MGRITKTALYWVPGLLKIVAVITLILLVLSLGALILSLVQYPQEDGAHWKLGVAVFTTGVAWVVLDRLIRLFSIIVSGDAFVPESSRYLRHIGFALIILQLLPFSGAFLPTAAPDWLHSNYVDGGNILAIIVIVILSEALRQGEILRDDVTHTV